MAFINGLFGLFVVIFMILMIIGLIKPSIVKMPSRGKAFITFLIATIVSIFLFGITTSDEEKASVNLESRAHDESENQDKFKLMMEKLNFSSAPEITTEQIKPIVLALNSSKNHIEKVELSNNQSLDIYLKPIKVFTSDMTLSETGMTAQNIFEALRKQEVNDLKNVRIHVSTALIDQYNNESVEEVFILDYDYTEILKLNVENTDLYQDYLKFAKFQRIQNVGGDIFNAWCSDSDNKKYSGTFCFQ